MRHAKYTLAALVLLLASLAFAQPVSRPAAVRVCPCLRSAPERCDCREGHCQCSDACFCRPPWEHCGLAVK
jgi:hypothetical protein